jgi:integrase
MKIYRRGEIYWACFGHNGEIFRRSLKTSDWQEAKRNEKDLIAQAHAGKIRGKTTSFARLPFHLDRLCCGEGCKRDLGDELGPLCKSCVKAGREAAAEGPPEFGAVGIYRRDHKPEIAATTRRSELDHSKRLAEFFKDTRVNKITENRIREYISRRHSAGIANATINKELYILIRILKRAKRWHLFAEEIKPLPTRPSEIARVLAYDEKLRLLRMSQAEPRWGRARLAMLLALNTTMRAGEIRNLQWQDVNWLEQTVQVRRGKTKHSQREIPLNREAFAAMKELRDQAQDVFGENLSPAWHIFFWQPDNKKSDATKPMKSWRSAWRSMTRAIRCPKCDELQDPGKICANEECKADIRKTVSPTAGLRFHDLRHQAITELSEGHASDETIMSIAGHINRRMMSHYSHVRKESRRAALDALCVKNGDYAQSAVHNRDSERAVPTQLIEKNGGDDGTRTRDLCRDRAAF